VLGRRFLLHASKNRVPRLRGLPGKSIVAAGVRYLKSARLRPDSLRKSQSNESILIESIVDKLSVPETFCEFGFDITEFNCSRLIRKSWRGLLIDGDRQRVHFANRVLKKDPTLQVVAECAFLDLDNLNGTLRRFLGKDKLGVLSIDVDGNDYWFMEALLPMQPALIVVEYNASFGLRPITVPYDPGFDRHRKHASGWYHGASLTALCGLTDAHGYALIAVSDAGGNAFFIRRDQSIPSFPPLDAHGAYRESRLRNQWSGTTAAEQWAMIEHMAYEQV
jgi:hypothetical protein